MSGRAATDAAPPATGPAPTRFGPPAAFAGCSLVWGSTFLAIRIGNDSLPPLWAASLRLGLASVMLLALTRLTGHALPRGAALRAAMQFGFLNFGLGFCLLYWGEKTVPSGITAVVYATVPLTTAIAAHALGMERLQWFKVMATLGAIAGVAVIFAGQIRSAVPPLPLVAILASATCGALSGVALKRGPRQNPLGANAVGALTGLVVCSIVSTLAHEPHPLPHTAAAWIPLLYLTIAGSLGAFVLYAYLVNHWPVSRASFIAVVVPVVALALGVVVGGERLTATAVIGSALVLVAVTMGVAARPPRSAA